CLPPRPRHTPARNAGQRYRRQSDKDCDGDGARAQLCAGRRFSGGRYLGGNGQGAEPRSEVTMKIPVGRAVFFLGFVLSAASLSAQTCACGANPPGPPANREQHPYANAPEDMRPFSKFTVPYYEHYGKL